MKDGGAPVIIGAAIALVGALVSALIAWAISRRTAYLNSVTVERSKWIDKLRMNLAELAGLCAYLHYKNSTSSGYQETPEHDEILHQIEKVGALIRLQLNPEGVIEQNIIEIVEGIARLAEKRKDFRVFTAHWLLIRHAQWLLKEEWETVKSEAAGSLRRIGAAVKRRRRAKAYQVFCTDDGSLAPLDKEPSTPP
jgi:hypothetical protein